jgi:tetratricopeptide (TPR) repeat protein
MADDDNNSAAGAPGSAPAAEAMALHAASRSRADAYLDEQTKLVRLQSENMIEQNAFELSHLKWRRFSDQMRGILYIFGVLVALVLMIAAGAFVWSAARSDGLVIEAFSVPPDFAQRGLTGEVVAGKVLDRLQTFQAQTQSNRAPSSYANNWGDDIKVQIPETGVSIGQLNRYLRQWLGHETEISGEVYGTPASIAVTARVGGNQSPTFTGSEADLDKLIEKAAESVYRATQPYRYAVYLSQHGRDKESRAVYQQLIADGPPLERGWAYIGLAADLQQNGKPNEAIAVVRRAIAERPDLLLAYVNLSNYEGNLQHDDASLAPLLEFVSRAKAGDSSMGHADLAYNLITARHSIATSVGDFGEALSVVREGLKDPDRSGSHETLSVNIVGDCGALHDAACVRQSYAALPLSDNANVLVNRIGTLQIADTALHDWRAVLALKDREIALLKSMGPAGEFFIPELENPVTGLAESELGNFPAAEATLADCPANGDVCMRTRGELRADEGKWGAADYWFSRAVHDSPKTPFGYEAWGEALLKKGDLDRAIALFEKAHDKGPHFADPLEMWGEALTRANRSDLALAKFEEADKYAPNWGRLHLKWGEALWWLGKRDEARAQFAIAAHLDLTPSEKSQLARMGAAHAG